MTNTILAIDSATGPCSVAIARGGELLAEAQENVATAQSRLLLPMIESTLKQARLEYSDLNAIVSTVGPGSFTGLRIGLAAARGIAFAARKQVQGITTLATLAFAAAREFPKSPLIAAALNAGKGEVYFQLFQNRNSILPASEISVGPLDRLMSPLPANGNVFVGNIAVEKIPAGWQRVERITTPQARFVALAAAAQPSLLIAAQPMYVRAPDAIPQSAC